MTQPPYLMRENESRTSALVQVEIPRVTLPKVYRRVDRGHYERLDDTGKVETDRLLLMASNQGRQVRPTGEDDKQTRVYATVARTAAGVKMALRRLRPQEAQQLDDLDTQIAEVAARLQALRAVRADLVRTAWTKANVVRLAEAEAFMEES